MKKFQFRLQKLLDLRRFREKEAETALGRAVADRDAITLRLMTIAEREADTCRSLQNSKKTFEDLSAHADYIERLHIERDQHLMSLAEAELVIEQLRTQYIKAHQERLIVTKLREKKQLQWKTDLYRQQESVLDDIINSQEYHKNTYEHL